MDFLVEQAVAEFGRIDVLVNNAGVMDRMSAVHETDDAEWERVLRVDLTAPFLLTRAVLPHMLAAGGGPWSSPAPRPACAAVRPEPRTPPPSTGSPVS